MAWRNSKRSKRFTYKEKQSYFAGLRAGKKSRSRKGRR